MHTHRSTHKRHEKPTDREQNEELRRGRQGRRRRRAHNHGKLSIQTHRDFSVSFSYFSPNPLPDHPGEEQISWASPAALLACFARYRPPSPQARAAGSGDKFLCLFDVIEQLFCLAHAGIMPVERDPERHPYSSIVQAHPAVPRSKNKPQKSRT